MANKTADADKCFYKSVVSAEECKEIVRNSMRVKSPVIVDYEIHKIPGHIGFLGEYLELDVTVENNGTRTRESYFLKSLPLTDKNQRAMMEECGFFRKEVLMYSKILAGFGHNEGLSKWRPDCYYTREDLIVLEDLKRCHGFSMVHFMKPLDQSHVHLVLQAVTQMHAVSLNYEYNVAGGKRLDEIFSEVLFEISVSRKNSWFMAGLSGIKAISLNGTKYCKDPVKKNLMEQELDNKLNHIFEVVEPTTQFQNVVTHRDIWHNNIMFTFDKDLVKGTDNLDSPKSCILLDFQICRYLPPAIDFLLTIYLTTTRSQREEFYQEYLAYYYNTLATKLRQFQLDPEQILSWDQLQRSLDHYKIVAHVFAGVYLALTNLPANVLDELHREDPERYHHYCNINRDEFMLKYLREDAFYHDTMTECVEETLEYFFGFEVNGCN